MTGGTLAVGVADGADDEIGTGLVESGEPIETAVRRELKEETGLELISIDSISPLTYSSSGLSDETAAVAFVKA